LARYVGSRSLKKRPLKEPSLLADLLSADDWSIITQYVDLLQPLKRATILLQGYVSTTAKDDRSVKGAIWQVLLIFETMMTAFEQARERYLLKATLDQRSQQADSQPSAPSPPLATPSQTPVRTIRSSQSIPIPWTSAPTDSSASQNEPIVSEEQTTESDDAVTDGTSESQKHFLTNINLA
jgi:hypothetical protein